MQTKTGANRYYVMNYSAIDRLAYGLPFCNILSNVYLVRRLLDRQMTTLFLEPFCKCSHPLTHVGHLLSRNTQRANFEIVSHFTAFGSHLPQKRCNCLQTQAFVSNSHQKLEIVCYLWMHTIIYILKCKNDFKNHVFVYIC